MLGYNTSFVFCSELVPGTVSLIEDCARATTVNNTGIIPCVETRALFMTQKMASMPKWVKTSLI